MAYKITKVDDKNKDWKVISIMGADGNVLEDISVNRANKKGEIFPNFDGIVQGADVEGQLWASPAGKQYLFAPKKAVSRPGSAPDERIGKILIELTNILVILRNIDANTSPKKKAYPVNDLGPDQFPEEDLPEENF